MTPGFYHVKIGGKWTVAEYVKCEDIHIGTKEENFPWRLIGKDSNYSDNVIEEVGKMIEIGVS